MASLFDQLKKGGETYEEKEEAIPEPRLIKRAILEQQQNTRDAFIEWQKFQDKGRLEDFKEAVMRYYDIVWPIIEDVYLVDEDIKKELMTIETDMFNYGNGLNAKKWFKRKKLLDKTLNKIGITKIGIKRKQYDMGYEIWAGTPFDGKKSKKFREWMNWYRLKANVRNFAMMLRNDVDGLIAIWGGNRTGKSTLGLHLMAQTHPKKITKKNFVFDSKDFWAATGELPQYGSFLIDELSALFYSKDTMKKGQKRRKKKLKTYAKKNMLVFGCDLNLYNLDKEMISDKLTAGIYVPKRGKFEFYSKEKIQDFEKDKKTGEAVTPPPSFKGRFPPLDGRIWDLYKEEEDRKVQKEKEEEENENKVSEDLKHECSQCGHKWVGRKKNPARCPKCHTSKWDEDLK